MSAIAGLFHPATPKPVDPARLRAMASAMAHRGPDGAGEWTAPGVGFAHRGLAIGGGHDVAQPVATADLRYALVLDGTILNHAALRDELRALGHPVADAGDAEVVLHGFAAWGPSLLDRLEGAFAFAVHDAATQTLFLARDRLGVKPLHYVTLPDGALAFASELKGLLAHPLLRRAPDVTAIDDFLAFGHVPDDACVMAGVRKLPAAHFLLIERGRAARPPRRWWQMRFDGAATHGGELLERLRAAAATVDGATVLLSGAVADAGLVALLAERRARAVPTVAVVGADAVAQRFATAHRAESIDAAALIPAAIAAFDEPFADPAALHALAGARLARAAGPVMADGTGAERLLHGAARHRGFATRERWRQSAWMPSVALRVLGTTAQDHARAIRAVPDAVRAALFSAAGRGAVQGHRPGARYAAAMHDAAADDPLDRAHAADLAIDLPARDLAIADRAGMAAGVDWRVPMLDHRLVAFATALPRATRAGAASPIAAALARHLPALPPVLPLAPPALPATRWRVLEESGWFDPDPLARVPEPYRALLTWRLTVLEHSLARLFA